MKTRKTGTGLATKLIVGAGLVATAIGAAFQSGANVGYTEKGVSIPAPEPGHYDSLNEAKVVELPNYVVSSDPAAVYEEQEGLDNIEEADWEAAWNLRAEHPEKYGIVYDGPLLDENAPNPIIYDNGERNYISDPGSFEIDEPDYVTLARVMYAEARGEWRNREILKHKGSSAVNRALDGNQTIKQAILEKNQYHATEDSNAVYFANPSMFVGKSKEDSKSWQTCLEVASDIIEGGTPYDTYFTIHRNSGDAHPEEKYEWVGRLPQKVKDDVMIIPTTRGEYYFYSAE